LDSSIERNFIFEKRGSAQDELKMENVQGLPAEFLWEIFCDHSEGGGSRMGKDDGFEQFQ
jgi:hypothetical protein